MNEIVGLTPEIYTIIACCFFVVVLPATLFIVYKYQGHIDNFDTCFSSFAVACASAFWFATMPLLTLFGIGYVVRYLLLKVVD